MHHTSIGVFRYSPLVNGLLVRRDGGSTRWWLIIDADPDLGRYLRHLLLLGSFRTQSAQSPLWGPHISVIRGEEPIHRSAWERLAGQEVEFSYDLDVQHTDGYFWLRVQCDLALDHREELGLSRQPTPELHLTIGNSMNSREI